MVLGANEERFREFLGELKPSERDRVEEIWFGLLRTAASNEERVRD